MKLNKPDSDGEAVVGCCIALGCFAVGLLAAAAGLAVVILLWRAALGW